jgi:nicotinate phosphoribosyltransferase
MAVQRFGDKRVTYAVFMRRPVLSAPRLMVSWLEEVAANRGVSFEIEVCHPEGELVGAGEVLVYVSGPMAQLVDLETLYLQLLGAPCVAAYNAYTMCRDLPRVAYLAMDARHCTGPGMMDLMAYAAAVGSEAAKREVDAVGFIGNATDDTAHYFGNEQGLGTMPHALIGYAGSTLAAAKMFAETFPGEPMTVLVDYYGREITDALDAHAPEAVRQYRTDVELHWLIGTGVSAAAIHHLRDTLDEAGFAKTKIVVSSGFGPEKCKVMGLVDAPIDVIGTGSYLPDYWHETYATADIVVYDGEPSVKVGREFLLKKVGD